MKWMSLLLSAWIVLFATVGWGCPFCGGPPTQTWSELLAEADVAVVAKLVSVDEGNAARRPVSLVEIIQIHKGQDLLTSDQQLPKQLRIPEGLAGQAGDSFLLLASLTKIVAPDNTFAEAGESTQKKSDIRKVSATVDETQLSAREILDWNVNLQLGPATFDYIANAPIRETDSPDNEKRLRYFAPFLEDKDDTIAVDAWSEFANSEYVDVVAIRHELNPAKLRQWIASPDTSPERLGLYGMMLGLCGNQQDALFLKQQIGLPSEELRFGIEGLMGGYLLLSDDAALNDLNTRWLLNENASSFDVMAVRKALQFIWDCEPDMFTAERLQKSLYPLVRREDLREIAIIDLARWQDWSAVTMLPDVYAQCKTADPRSATAIVQFLLTMQKSLNDEPDHEFLGQAQALLAQIRDENPRLVRSAERFAN